MKGGKMRQTRLFGILVMFLMLVTIPSAEASITLRTDKTSYYVGEPVTFTISNNNNYPITVDIVSHYARNIYTGMTYNTARSILSYIITTKKILNNYSYLETKNKVIVIMA